MNRRECNSKSGIAKHLSTYEDLYALSAARKQIKSGLKPFVVLGRFLADEHGQWTKLNRTVFTDEHRKLMPPVMTHDEFLKFVDAQGLTANVLLEDDDGGCELRPPHVMCARCGRGWALADCHDYVESGAVGNLIVGYADGKKLGDVQATLDARTNALYYAYVEADSDDVLDEDGEFTGVDRDPNRVIKPGEVVLATIYRFYHGACYRELMKEFAKAELENLLASFQIFLNESGFKQAVLTNAPVPEYAFSPEDFDDPGDREIVMRNLPYFRVKSSLGEFGLLLASFVLLDLTGSGVSLKELLAAIPLTPEERQDAEKMPDDQFVPLVDERVMPAFKTLLEKRQNIQ